MAKHKVTFTVPERPLGKTDIELKIKKDDELLGVLKVSKGGPDWFPKRGRHQRVSWTTLANWMEAHRDGKLKTQLK